MVLFSVAKQSIDSSQVKAVLCGKKLVADDSMKLIHFCFKHVFLQSSHPGSLPKVNDSCENDKYLC